MGQIALRAIDFNANYIDNFTDIAIDVDGDGWVDVVNSAISRRKSSG